jgi:hypothetical protein
MLDRQSHESWQRDCVFFCFGNCGIWRRLALDEEAALYAIVRCQNYQTSWRFAGGEALHQVHKLGPIKDPAYGETLLLHIQYFVSASFTLTWNKLSRMSAVIIFAIHVRNFSFRVRSAGSKTIRTTFSAARFGLWRDLFLKSPSPVVSWAQPKSKSGRMRKHDMPGW